MVAIRTGDADAVRALLEHGANPNTAEPQLQLTPLMVAAEAGYTEIVASLIKGGADIQVRTRTGATPARRLPCVRIGLWLPRRGDCPRGFPNRAPVRRFPGT